MLDTMMSHSNIYWQRLWKKLCPYGLDAPYKILKLLNMSIGIWLTDEIIRYFLHHFFPITANIILGTIIIFSLLFFIPVIWIILTSCFLKERLAKQVIQLLNLKGSENVLDVDSYSS